MKVRDLIRELAKCDPDAYVGFGADGAIWAIADDPANVGTFGRSADIPLQDQARHVLEAIGAPIPEEYR